MQLGERVSPRDGKDRHGPGLGLGRRAALLGTSPPASARSRPERTRPPEPLHFLRYSLRKPEDLLSLLRPLRRWHREIRTESTAPTSQRRRPDGVSSAFCCFPLRPTTISRLKWGMGMSCPSTSGVHGECSRSLRCFSWPLALYSPLKTRGLNSVLGLIQSPTQNPQSARPSHQGLLLTSLRLQQGLERHPNEATPMTAVSAGLQPHASPVSRALTLCSS